MLDNIFAGVGGISPLNFGQALQNAPAASQRTDNKIARANEPVADTDISRRDFADTLAERVADQQITQQNSEQPQPQPVAEDTQNHAESDTSAGSSSEPTAEQPQQLTPAAETSTNSGNSKEVLAVVKSKAPSAVSNLNRITDINKAKPGIVTALPQQNTKAAGAGSSTEKTDKPAQQGPADTALAARAGATSKAVEKLMTVAFGNNTGKSSQADKPTQASGESSKLPPKVLSEITAKLTTLSDETTVSPKKSLLDARQVTDSQANTAQQTKPATIKMSLNLDNPQTASQNSSDGTKVASAKLQAGFQAEQLKISDWQISNSSAKPRPNTTGVSNSCTDAGHHLSMPQNPAPAVEYAAVAAKLADKLPSLNNHPGLDRQVTQLVQNAARQADSELTIRLNPPELGRLCIKFSQQGDDVTGLLQVQKAETKAEIQQLLPTVVRNLADAGIQIKRLDIMLAQDSHGQAQKDNSALMNNGNWDGQNQFDQPQGAQTAPYLRWSESGYEFVDSALPHLSPIADGSINMLM